MDNKKPAKKESKPKVNPTSVEQLVKLLDQILELKNKDPQLLDKFQENVLKALKEDKESSLQKVQQKEQKEVEKKPPQITLPKALEELQKCKYLEKVDLKIENGFILSQNKDKNDIFRILFIAFALNISMKALVNNACPFTTFDYQQKKEFVETQLKKPSTTINVSNDINAQAIYYNKIVVNVIMELIDMAQSMENNFTRLCHYLVQQLQNPIFDLAIVAFMRAIIFEAPADNTPQFEQLQNISSEFYNKGKMLHDLDEFWWKTANATFSFLYLTDLKYNQIPKKKGYPRIFNKTLQMPDIYLIKEEDIVMFKIDPNYQPMIVLKSHPIKQPAITRDEKE